MRLVSKVFLTNFQGQKKIVFFFYDNWLPNYLHENDINYFFLTHLQPPRKMDIRFNCYLSYLIKVYLLGLSVAIIINGYSFYTYGRDTCEYSISLYRQSIAAIFAGIFTTMLLVCVLVIPDTNTNQQTTRTTTMTTTTTTTRTSNNNSPVYYRAIVAFTVLYLISALLTILGIYLFIQTNMFDWPHELGGCDRLYYDVAFATTILSAIPVFLIGMGVIGLIINLVAVCLDSWCCRSCHTCNLPRTNRDTQTTPAFINPDKHRAANSRSYSPGFTDSPAISLDGDDFTFDAPELQLSHLITLDTQETHRQPQPQYPSRKFQYLAIPTSDTTAATTTA